MKGKKNHLILLVLLVVALGMSAISYFGITIPDMGWNKTLSAENIKLGLDLSGGVYVVYEAQDENGNPIDNPSSEDMNAASAMIRTRLDNQGWSDGEVSIENGDRLRVEIPNESNANEVISRIGAAGVLQFVDSQGNVLLTGERVSEANVQINSDQQQSTSASRYCVGLKFDSEGTQLFKEATQNNIGKPIHIVLDNTAVSSPTVNSAITDGSAVITGQFTKDEAANLASIINSGSLPFKLEPIESQTIGATLGEDSLSSSLFAGCVGIALVFIFMIIFYRVSGVAADWALVIYLAAELIIINGLDITLTLPGIAGIILSVGMAVDANVIIFERIKEELAAGRTLRLAVQNGFSRAFPAIFDSNITTLIACFVLFWLGTGPIKGFAQTLALGIVLSMFTALVITRFILKALVGVGVKNPKFFGGK